MRPKGYNLGYWVGLAVGTIALLGFFSSLVVRVSAAERETKKVAGVEKKVTTLFIWAQLMDPVRFRQAEELTK